MLLDPNLGIFNFEMKATKNSPCHILISLNFLPLVSSFISSLFNFHYSSPFNLCLWQLLEINSVDLIAEGNSDISSRQSAANKFLDKVFRVQLGRGFYGECLVNITFVCVYIWI